MRKFWLLIMALILLTGGFYTFKFFRPQLYDLPRVVDIALDQSEFLSFRIRAIDRLGALRDRRATPGLLGLLRIIEQREGALGWGAWALSETSVK